MKKIITLVVALMFVLSISAVSFAADKPAAAPAAPAKAAPAKAEEKEITGEVTAVDAKANTIKVKDQKAEATIALNDKTAFEPKGKTKADVKAGVSVNVKYTVADGKNTAVKVVIQEKKAAPAAPAAPAKKAGGY